ncbi:hypothetical protein R3P38DRAFT_3559883 [Favolaschia claudopus]|uniref:C2H2-type domain-containing protein n=1 Tax=Favolaschia claudopus TaxID=2862362 RepID=A0AAW0AWM4_9AGAR
MSISNTLANTPNVSPGGNPNLKVLDPIHNKENVDCFKRPAVQCAVSELASDDTLKSIPCTGRAPDDSLTNATSTEPGDVLSTPPVQCADASNSSSSDATTPAARILTVKTLTEASLLLSCADSGARHDTKLEPSSPSPDASAVAPQTPTLSNESSADDGDITNVEANDTTSCATRRNSGLLGALVEIAYVERQRLHDEEDETESEGDSEKEINHYKKTHVGKDTPRLEHPRPVEPDHYETNESVIAKIRTKPSGKALHQLLLSRSDKGDKFSYANTNWYFQDSVRELVRIYPFLAVDLLTPIVYDKLGFYLPCIFDDCFEVIELSRAAAEHHVRHAHPLVRLQSSNAKGKGKKKSKCAEQRKKFRCPDKECNAKCMPHASIGRHMFAVHNPRQEVHQTDIFCKLCDWRTTEMEEYVKHFKKCEKNLLPSRDGDAMRPRQSKRRRIAPSEEE